MLYTTTPVCSYCHRPLPEQEPGYISFHMCRIDLKEEIIQGEVLPELKELEA